MEEQRQISSEILSRFSTVAATNPYASSREPYATGSLGTHKTASAHRHGAKVNEEDEFEDE